MKMLLMTAVLAFAPYVHAADTQDQQQPQQSMAAVCDMQMDQDQDLAPACAARVSCLAEDGQQTADCQAYCAANSTDEEACAIQTEDGTQVSAEMSRRWHGGVRFGRGHRWHRYHGWCDRHPFARGCW